jgi:1,3-beta-glucan synthase
MPISLAIMYLMDLILYFLDTYLWYIIWLVVFSVGRSFALGLSIWTPWKDIYTRMPKRMYAKLLATGEMEVKYKPKVRATSLCLILAPHLAPGFGLATVERSHYIHVPRAPPVDRPRPAASLPSG